MRNRTKMFHVKHFGTIWAENLTESHTAASSLIGKIGQFFGAIRREQPRRADDHAVAGKHPRCKFRANRAKALAKASACQSRPI
jgi:hypothetical protein